MHTSFLIFVLIYIPILERFFDIFWSGILYQVPLYLLYIRYPSHIFRSHPKTHISHKKTVFSFNRHIYFNIIPYSTDFSYFINQISFIHVAQFIFYSNKDN